MAHEYRQDVSDFYTCEAGGFLKPGRDLIPHTTVYKGSGSVAHEYSQDVSDFYSNETGGLLKPERDLIPHTRDGAEAYLLRFILALQGELRRG